MTDYCITDFQNEFFQEAFKLYFDELGIVVDNWNAVFTELKKDKETLAYLKKDDNNQIIGFILFKQDALVSSFFTEPIGFIREFWIKNNFRNNGYGSELLRKAETYFKKYGITKIFLTTDTAEGFYLKQGYILDNSIQAKNEDPVFVKVLV